MEIYKKLQKCREAIKLTDVNKLGHNDYSNYDYFTPEQIHQLAFEACKEANLFYKFDLNRDEFGYVGNLSIIDLDDNTSIIFTQRTDIPVLKATNITQQIGGAVTYTLRYLLMTVFDIQDNTIDPDTTQNTKSREENKKEATKEFKQKTEEAAKPWLNKYLDKAHTKEDPKYWKVVNGAKEKNLTVKDLREYYKINKETASELETDLN